MSGTLGDDCATVQGSCNLKNQQSGFLILLCDVSFRFLGVSVVNFGTSSAKIVSLVYGKAMRNGERVTIRASVINTVETLKPQMASSETDLNSSKN